MSDGWESRMRQIAKDTGLIGAAIVGLAGTSPGVRYAHRLAQAAHRLHAVTDPMLWGQVKAEVDRRTELMGEAAAYESVGDDVVAGRWPR